MHSCQILADDVKFDVNNSAFFDGMKVCVVVGVGDDADLESVFSGTTYSEAYAVDGHAAFVHGEVSVLYHLFCAIVAECILITALLVFDCNTNGCLVNMSLYDMAVSTAVH